MNNLQRRQFYEVVIQFFCFISPIFSDITDVIIERVKHPCNPVWPEKQNFRNTAEDAYL